MWYAAAHRVGLYMVGWIAPNGSVPEWHTTVSEYLPHYYTTGDERTRTVHRVTAVNYGAGPRLSDQAGSVEPLNHYLDDYLDDRRFARYLEVMRVGYMLPTCSTGTRRG